MVKRNTPDWQISAFDKVDNSCVKTKPFNEKIKELEKAYAKSQETKAKVEDIDTSTFYLKEEPVKEEKDDKVDVLKEYQEMRDRQRKKSLKSREEMRTRLSLLALQEKILIEECAF